MITSYQQGEVEKPRGTLRDYKRFKRRGKVKRFTQESIPPIQFEPLPSEKGLLDKKALKTGIVKDWGKPEYQTDKPVSYPKCKIAA